MTENSKLNRLNETTSVAINTRVSPGLHPDVVTQHGNLLVDDKGGPGETGYAAARKAYQAIYTSLTDITDAHTAMLRPIEVGRQKSDGKPIISMKIPPERASELASAMGSKAQHVGTSVQRCTDVIDESIAQLESRVSVALKHPRADTTSVSTEAAQIRDYVKNLPRGQRPGFLHDAAVRKDLTVISAVVNASPWISGLTHEEQDTARMHARAELAPRESAQADALRKIKNGIEGAVQNFGAVYFKLLPQIKEDKREAALQKLKGASQ